MKKIQFTFILALFAGLLFTTACNEKGKEKESETQTTEKKKQKKETKSVSCKVDSMSFSFGESEQQVSFTYEDGKLIKTFLTGSRGQETTAKYSYTDDGKLEKIEYQPNSNVLTYVYDAQGKLIRIDAKGNFMPREFEYDENDNIIKQTMLFNGKPYGYSEYTYDRKGNLETCTVYNKDNVNTQTIEFKYDNKINPMVNWGVFLNQYELMYGYPVGNLTNNPKKIITTYETESKWKIDGEKKQAGDVDRLRIKYKYNKHDYPEKITINDDVMNLYYSCK